MGWRWRIRHKLGAGLLLVLGIVAILAGGAFYGLYSFRRSNKGMVYHGQLTIRAMELEHQVLQLTFSDAGRADPLGSMPQKLDAIDDCVRLYRAVLDKSPGYALSPAVVEKQHACLERIGTLVEKCRGLAKGEQDGARRPNNWMTTLRDDAPKALHNELTVLIADIGFQQQENLARHRNNYRTALALVYSSTPLVVLLLAGLVRLGYQAVFQPVRELHRGVAKLAQGDFAARVAVETGDEMQDLAEAFNDMGDRLEASYRDLQRQVEERSRQLIRSERLASVGFLAAGVAHEINNPLASIAFCAEALEGRLRPPAGAPPPDAEGQVVANYLKMIEQEAFRCKGITEKLLDFSRAGASERGDVEVSAVVREVLEMVRTLGRAKGKELRFEPGGPAFCWANAAELKQVLLNLVVNALESVDDGGLVEVRTRASAAGAEIVVRDDGCGMAPDVLENLFEPFFTRCRTGKGTGLGLSISHLIVSQHGGTLEAASGGPGQGSVFSVRLPARSVAAVRLAA